MRWNEIIEESFGDIALPNWANHSCQGMYAVFANPDGLQAKLYRSEHGQYVADVDGRYDITVNTLEELQKKLTKDGFTNFVGIKDD